MATRALRRARKEQEEQALATKLEEKLKLEDGEEEGEEEVEDEEQQPIKKNLFDLLNEAEDDDNDGEEEAVEAAEELEKEEERADTPSKKKKSKKKKKKGKGAAEGDEIDRALRELSKKTNAEPKSQATQQSISTTSTLSQHLKIDSRNLDPDNEMRKLFGRAAVRENEETAGPRARNRRMVVPGQPRVQAGKRNVFVQSGEGWPPGTSGGLGMELVERRADGSIEFKYVHSRAYADAQRQFIECVLSGDPQQMISFLQINPYHVSTLLQTSHILLTQNNPPDYNMSGDLISKALYTLGRSTHSVFPTTFASGLARLDFNVFANRELWLAGWKYMDNLMRRGLWRTTLEMCRTLLQMDPIGDPLCMALCIDQYCLKARQAQMLLDLYHTSALNKTWMLLPSMRYSIALAHFQLNQHEEARQKLREAILAVPWIIADLYSVLNIDNVPAALWSSRPATDEDTLLAKLYAHRCTDLWGIPEATSLLTSIASSISTSELQSTDDKKAVYTDGGILHAEYYYSTSPQKPRNIARHILLLDVREITSHLPNDFKTNPGFSGDILPPPDSDDPYQLPTFRTRPVVDPAVIAALERNGDDPAVLHQAAQNFAHNAHEMGFVVGADGQLEYDENGQIARNPEGRSSVDVLENFFRSIVRWGQGDNEQPQEQQNGEDNADEERRTNGDGPGA